MTALRMLLAAALLAGLGGCFKVEINTPNFGNEGGGQGKSAGPSQLPAAGGSWRDIASGAFGQILAAENGFLFFGYDTLAYPAEPVELTAKIFSVRGLAMTGVEGVMVGFYRDEQLAGLAETDEKGKATIQFTPPAAGDYRFRSRPISAELPEQVKAAVLALTPAPLLVAARDKNTRFVVIDLDHTVVDSSFWRVLLGGAKPMDESVRVTKRIAKKYGLVYLTARPDLLARKSKSWLAGKGFPAGPLLLSNVETMFKSGQFKTSKLAAMQKAFPNVAIGIGDKYSDAQAYVDNNMTAYLIPHYNPDKVKSVRAAAAKIRQLKGKGRLNVVTGWTQIEAGIFSGRQFPPEPFAKELTRRAKKLEADERARKRDERRREEEEDEDDHDD